MTLIFRLFVVCLLLLSPGVIPITTMQTCCLPLLSDIKQKRSKIPDFKKSLKRSMQNRWVPSGLQLRGLGRGFILKAYFELNKGNSYSPGMHYSFFL